MTDYRQSAPIGSERQLREQLDGLAKRQRDNVEGDVIVEYPRRLLLRSPNGHYWAITVDDAGKLSATDVGDMPR